MSPGYRARRFLRPAKLAVLGCAFIVGGCVAVQVAGAGGLPSGSDPADQPGTTVGAERQSPPPPKTPTWSGPLRVTDKGINMSYQPPTGDTIGGTATVQYDGDTQTLAIENQGPAAFWNSPDNPSYEECLALVRTQPLSTGEMQRVPYRQGHGLCVVTFGKSAMAFVRGTGAPGADAVEMHGLRWTLTG